MLIDLPLDELQRYRSSQAEPSDFDAFWSTTLAESRAFDLGLTITPVDAPRLQAIELYDVTFAGYGGQPVKAWLRLPKHTRGPLPIVIQYVGYGGGRGYAIDNLLWAAAGYAHLQMDTRGQGGSWSPGETADEGPTGPQVPGVMTRGIFSPSTYYYRRLITDAVRAVEVARALPTVDPNRVVLLGGSQGGGLALAVAGLVTDVSALFARVPFLCDFPRAITITDSMPYAEIRQFLSVQRGRAESALRTLSYFDGVNFATRATAPAWFTAALMDPITPPSTVYAAFNAYRGAKQITTWEFNGHEGGAAADDEQTLVALNNLFSLNGTT